MSEDNDNITRRRFLRYTASMAALAGVSSILPTYAFAGFNQRNELRPKGPDNVIDLTIGRMPHKIDGKQGGAIGINGTVPGPLIRLKEGQDVLLRVKNELDEPTSIHWHGILLPFEMDGVPGVSFPGIAPGETFEYRYPVRQSGTYWYHSHSGLQEQLGHYGPLVVDPAEPDPFSYERDYAVVLSDWTFDDPADVMRNLTVAEGYYNYNQRTVADFFADVERMGWQAAWDKAGMWGRMRMTPRDILDVTGSAYTYL